MEDSIQEIINELAFIGEDNTIPKNIRFKIKSSIDLLSNNDSNIDLRVTKSVEELGSVVEDPNIPQFTKMQIWSIVSRLESN